MSFLVNSCILRPVSLVLSPVILRLYYIRVCVIIYICMVFFICTFSCLLFMLNQNNYTSQILYYVPVQFALYLKFNVSIVECQIFMCPCGLHIFIFMYEYSLPVINPTLKTTILNFDLDKWCRNERFSTPIKFGYTQRSPHRNYWAFFYSIGIVCWFLYPMKNQKSFISC